MAIDIEAAAAAPKRARGDSGEVEMHSLKDQMDAASLAAATRNAQSNPWGRLCNTVAVPGGTVGRHGLPNVP